MSLNDVLHFHGAIDKGTLTEEVCLSIRTHNLRKIKSGLKQNDKNGINYFYSCKYCTQYNMVLDLYEFFVWKKI